LDAASVVLLSLFSTEGFVSPFDGSGVNVTASVANLVGLVEVGNDSGGSLDVLAGQNLGLGLGGRGVLHEHERKSLIDGVDVLGDSLDVDGALLTGGTVSAAALNVGQVNGIGVGDVVEVVVVDEGNTFGQVTSHDVLGPGAVERSTVEANGAVFIKGGAEVARRLSAVAAFNLEAGNEGSQEGRGFALPVQGGALDGGLQESRDVFGNIGVGLRLGHGGNEIPLREEGVAAGGVA